MHVSRSLSLSHALPAAATADRPALVEDILSTKDRVRVAGFFPGLGSRAFYRDLGRFLLDSGIPEITDIYQDAARALGFPGRPDLLLTASENLPGRKMERQGFIGAALLVHSLAVDAYLRHRAEKSGVPVGFVAYTGESFGVLTAAVAGGSLSVHDGVKIAQVFTPLMLLAAGVQSSDEAFARDIACYLPESARQAASVPEPFHVVGVKARRPESLGAALDAIRRTHPLTDVELHKAYSPTQANLYVRAGVKPEFDRFMAGVPDVTLLELKDPTFFLAHSARMAPARQALERFLDSNRIRFTAPRVPVVSNHDMSLLTTAADVRRGVLAMTDQVMASRDTCEVLSSLDADMILELGPGGKSVRLLRDNDIAAPVLGYTAQDEETGRLLRAVEVMDRLMTRLETLYATGDPLHHGDYDALRELFRLAAASDFCDDYFTRGLGRVITAEMLRPDRDGAPSFYQFLEVFQHTLDHREHIAVERGELITRARLKKRISSEDPALLGKAHVELKVIDRSGRSATRVVDTGRPEVVVFHFDALSHLDEEDLARRTRLLLEAQPTALQTRDQLLYSPGLEGDGLSGAGRRIVYQYLLFRTLVQHRPALVAQTDHYLEGGDTLGWLVALAVSGALSPADAVALQAVGEREEDAERILRHLTGAEIPLVSPEGVPVQSRKELQDATRAILRGRALTTEARRIHLNGNCQIVTLGSDLDATDVDAGPFATRVLGVAEPAEAWKKRLNPALDRFECACVLALTGENERVLHNARSRRVLSSTVYAYIHIDEAVVSFGKGGSESMTIFVRKEARNTSPSARSSARP